MSDGESHKEAAMTAREACSILVVDDEPNICESIQKALSRSGYDVTTSLNPFQALRSLETRTFDLVLCYIRMP